MRMSDDVTRSQPSVRTNEADDPALADRHGSRQPIDQEELIRRRLESLRRDPDVGGELWLLALIPAMVEAIDSGEWCGRPYLLGRFLEESLGPIPPCLASTATLMALLEQARPVLQAWGYLIQIRTLPDGGEVVSICGTDGRVPG